MPLLAPVTLFVIVITTISSYNISLSLRPRFDVQGSRGSSLGDRLRHLRERIPVLQDGYAAAEAVTCS
jgi:hypothetical protein